MVPGLLLCCLLLAGCGGDDGGEQAASPTVTTVAATSTTEPSSTSGAPTTTAGFAGTVIEAKVTGSTVETASRRVRIDLGEGPHPGRGGPQRGGAPPRLRPEQEVAPGRPAVIDFTADAPGVFEVELEQARLKLFELQVQ